MPKQIYYTREAWPPSFDTTAPATAPPFGWHLRSGGEPLARKRWDYSRTFEELPPQPISSSTPTPLGYGWVSQGAIYVPRKRSVEQFIAQTFGGIPNTHPITNANLYFSPYNWFSNGSGSLQANNVLPGSTYAISNNPGAYLKWSVTCAATGTVKLNLDTTSLNGISGTTLYTSVDGKALATQTLSYSASPVQITLSSTLTAGTHTFKIWFNNPVYTSDEWNTPLSAVTITGVELDANTQLVSQTPRSKGMICFGDSVTEGSGANITGGFDCINVYTNHLALALDAELGNIGWGLSGWTTGGSGNAPIFYDSSTPSASSWLNYSASRSRLYSGLLSPAPDYITVNHGANDGTESATVTTKLAAWLSLARAAAPNAKIYVLIPFDHRCINSLTNGFNNYQTATPDSNCFLLDCGAEIVAYTIAGGAFGDDPHPNYRGHAMIGAKLAKLIQATLASGSVATNNPGIRSGGRM